MTRKVCVVTGTRAEYGHLFWIIRALEEDSRAQLQIVVTGAHLSEAHGWTVDQIKNDGFTPDAEVNLNIHDDSPLSIAKGMGLGLEEMVRHFSELAPDLIVVLGDRYELLCAAQAALLLRIPVAHIHGGEVTEGAFDEAIRHSLTKMAHLHFPAAERYAKRLRQLGENPNCIYNFGAPGLDHIQKTQPLQRNEIEEWLGISLKDPILLVTYHPVTLGMNNNTSEVHSVIEALEQFSEKATILCTGVNADPEFNTIREAFHTFYQKHSQCVALVQSMGQQRYLSTMRLASVVVGNSSSGIIEAPALGVPTVNIGDRQKGRLRASSIIDCAANTQSIINAINKALDPENREKACNVQLAYGSGEASSRIVEVLITHPLENILMKKFFDITEVDY